MTMQNHRRDGIALLSNQRCRWYLKSKRPNGGQDQLISLLVTSKGCFSHLPGEREGVPSFGLPDSNLGTSSAAFSVA